MRSLWKWLRRAAMFFFCLLFLLYIVVFIRSKVPVTVHDEDLLLSRVSIPAGSNAFEKLEEAADHLWWPRDESDHIQEDLIEITNWDEEFAHVVLETNREALKGWEESTHLSAMQLPEFEMTEGVPQYLNHFQELSQLATVNENYLMIHGKDKEAFDAMLAHVKLGYQMQNGHGEVISYFLGIGVSAQALKSMCKWAATTNLRAEDFKVYIAELGALENIATDAMKNSIKAEYNSQKRIINGFPSGKINSKTGMPELRPTFLFPVMNYSKTKEMFAQGNRAIIESASSRFKDAKPVTFNTRKGPLRLLSGNAIGEVLYGLQISSGGAVLKQKCNMNVDLQATRTILALRAYQLSHGKLPNQLSELVPDYLDKVPMDDFDGQPLRYHPEQKIVYSVGKNLKDDGGDDRAEEEWNTSERHLDTVFRFSF